jgi:AcrR family transcriptional regulator
MAMAARPRKAIADGAPRRSYHHGNLRQALVEATLQLLEDQSPETVTVREAARRAGVSSGAPFRHFANRTALLTAVAEEAHRRFRDEIARALAVAPDDPTQRFRAIGLAYLHWALGNPTLFRVISTRGLIDFDGSEYLQSDNRALRSQIETLMREAQRHGQIREGELAHLELAARALVYGLARMAIDGHFAQWSIAGESAVQSMEAVIDLFLAMAAAPSLRRRTQTRPRHPEASARRATTRGKAVGSPP